MAGIRINNGVNNRGNVPNIEAGTLLNRPAAVGSNLLYIDEVTPAIYYDNGAWITIAETQDLSGYVQKWETWQTTFQILTSDDFSHFFDGGYFFNDNGGNAYFLSVDGAGFDNILNDTNLRFDASGLIFFGSGVSYNCNLSTLFGNFALFNNAINLGFNSTDFYTTTQILDSGVVFSGDFNATGQFQVGNSIVNSTSLNSENLFLTSLSVNSNVFAFNGGLGDTSFSIDSNNFRYQNATTGNFFDYTDNFGLSVIFDNSNGFDIQNNQFRFFNSTTNEFLQYIDGNGLRLQYNDGSLVCRQISDGVLLSLTDSVSVTDIFEAFVGVGATPSYVLSTIPVTINNSLFANSVNTSNYQCGVFSSAPVNPATPVNYMSMEIAGNSYRIPLFQ